jgi:hypothetical protein
MRRGVLLAASPGVASWLEIAAALGYADEIRMAEGRSRCANGSRR